MAKKKYCVFLEIYDIPSKAVADDVTEKVQHRFDDVEYEVNVCISEYYKREKINERK